LGIAFIDSREVAEMLEKENKEIMRMIDSYDPLKESTKRRIVGIAPTLTKGNVTLGDNFIAKIEIELKTLETLGLSNVINFKVAKYYDSQNKERPCYELERDGILMLLNSESTLVRLKTIEYINILEVENQKLKQEQQLILANNEIEYRNI
jgi:phage regulator Rha-like protein